MNNKFEQIASGFPGEMADTQPQKEGRESLVLKRENIVPIKKLGEVPKFWTEIGRPKEWLRGWGFRFNGDEAMKTKMHDEFGIDTSALEKGDYTMGYVKGDILLSFPLIVHELGHLREELNEDLCSIVDNGADRNSAANYPLFEEDATQRGLERVKLYTPSVLEEVDKRFNAAKLNNSNNPFPSFENFYLFNFSVKGGLGEKIASALGETSGIEDADLSERKMEELLLRSGAKEDYEKVSQVKCGEEINEEWVRDLCMLVWKGIENEKSDILNDRERTIRA